MGIGAAFATGIVAGLTRNMEMEFQKRVSDQEKIDQLNLLMAEYNMKPADEKSASGMNAVQDAITKAQGQVDRRGPVNLLGTRSAELDIDMAKIGQTLEETASGEWYVGEGKNKVWFQGKFPDSMNVSTANSFFGEMQGHLANPETVKILSTNKNAYEKLNGLVAAGIAAKNDASMESGRDELLVFNPELLSWYGEWQKIGKIVNSGGATTDLETQAADSYQKANPDMNVVGVFTKEGGDGSIMMGPIAFDGFDNQAGLEKTFGEMGIALGASSSSSVYTAYKNGITQLVKADGTLLTEEDQMVYFADSIKLGTAIPYIRRIRPGQGLYSQPRGGYGGLYQEINKYNTDGTFENGVFALYPHMIDSENGSPYKVGMTMGAYQELERNEDAANFALVLHYGADNLAGKTFQTLVTERDANRTVVKELQEFAKIAAEIGYPAAYGKFKQIFRFLGDLGTAVFSDLGFVEKMGFTEAEKARIREGDFSEDFLASLQEQVERARGRGVNEEGISYAELTSLKIGLAFKMARAADPSGRLSNQDVLQQLERLGTDFDTAEQVIAKVGVVVEEFESKYKKLDVLVKYGRGDGGRLSATKKAVIEAAVAFDHISRQAALGTGEKAFRPTYNFYDIEPNLFTKNGLPVFRAYKNSTSDVYEQKDGQPVRYTNVGTGDNPKFAPVSESMLTTDKSVMSGGPTNPTVDTAGRPIPTPNNPALMGMKGAGPEPVEPRTNPTVDTAGRPVPTNPVTGPRMNPTVDAAGRPVSANPVTGPRMNPTVDTAGRPVQANVVEDAGPVDQGAAVIDRLTAYIADLEKKLRGEDGEAQEEEEAVRTARGPTGRPRARPKERAIQEDRTNASGDPAEEGQLPMTESKPLLEGQFSRDTHDYVSGDNVTGMKIRNAETGQVEEGLFVIDPNNGNFTPKGK
mgnify:CR=1 FL=1